ncbi:MAG TPA: HAD family phosphatase [Candidatus Nanoarchaeia archaeon]|nr:HAD family phosphatase [Candidatus Nanoarchaeia archaeon]
MIKVIIFDFGNVVLTNDWNYVDEMKDAEYADYFGVSIDALRAGWKANWPDFFIGKTSEDEFWKGFLDTAGSEKKDIEYAKFLWRKYQKPKDGMLELLRKLKQNYRLAGLPNIGKEWLDYKRDKYNLDELFEVIVDSGHAGIQKPDIRIYQLVIEKMNAEPKECLFIDDKKENLEPAEKLGMKTILFTGIENLKKELSSLKISF